MFNIINVFQPADEVTRKTLNVTIDSFDPFQPSSFHNPVVLKRIDFQYDGIVQNVTLNNGDEHKFRGYNSVTASSIIINTGSTADFSARNEVNIQHDFETKRGSETHIYLSASDCDNSLFSTFNKIASPNSNFVNGEAKSIEINFRKNKGSFEIYPNPNAGKFKVSIYSDNCNNAKCEVLDISGRLVFKKILNTNLFDIDLSHLSKGIYQIRTTLQNEINSQKIIIN
jgi:hypothetical protein